MIAENCMVVEVNDWHFSWAGNEKRHKKVYCMWNIAGVATGAREFKKTLASFDRCLSSILDIAYLP